MNKKIIISIFVISFIIEITISLILFNKIESVNQDTLKVNEVVKSIEENYLNEEKYDKELDYTLLINDEVIYKTNNSKSNSINDAIKNNDIILDIKLNEINGKILIKNNTEELIDSYKKYIFISIIIMSLIQIILIIIYFIYLNKIIIKPFDELNDFAFRVAEGNLDIPLYMDRHNVFGKFSEAFDIMR